MLPKSFIVLGVSHRVQGDGSFVGAYHDPDYATAVREIISDDRIDFVGEERANIETIAERITREVLGEEHYVSVDPPIAHRTHYDIGETYRPPPLSGPPVHTWIVSENEKRELIWVNRLVEARPREAC